MSTYVLFNSNVKTGNIGKSDLSTRKRTPALFNQNDSFEENEWLPNWMPRNFLCAVKQLNLNTAAENRAFPTADGLSPTCFRKLNYG